MGPNGVLVLLTCWFAIGFIAACKFIEDNYGSSFMMHPMSEKVSAILLSICLTLLGPVGYAFFIIVL